jgi:hypothetical protein
MSQESMTPEKMLQAIRRTAKKLKRTPGFRDLKTVGVTRGVLERRWGGLQNALTAAGVEAAGTGFRFSDPTLLLDWARVVRKLRRIPGVLEYRKHGRFCHAPLHAPIAGRGCRRPLNDMRKKQVCRRSGRTCWR